MLSEQFQITLAPFIVHIIDGSFDPSTHQWVISVYFYLYWVGSNISLESQKSPNAYF